MTNLNAVHIAVKPTVAVLASLAICLRVAAYSLFSVSILRIEVGTRMKHRIASACVMALLQFTLQVHAHSQIRSDFALVDTGYALSLRPDRLHNLHAVWKRDDGLYYGRFDSLGNELMTPGKIPTTTGLSFSPRLAVAENRGLIVWEATTIGGTNAYIVGQLFTFDGNLLGNPFMINDTLVFDAIRNSPDVIELTDSSYVVVWSGEGAQTPSPSRGIYGQIITDLGLATGRNFLICSDIPNTNARGSARAASLTNGETCAIIWRDGYSGSNKIYSRVYSGGQPRTSTFLVSENSALAEVWFDAISASSESTFTAVWGGRIDTTWSVQLRTFDINGSFRAPSRTIDSAAGAYASVDIATDSDGKQIAVWEGNQMDHAVIFAQRITSDGEFFGRAFRVSSNADTSEEIYPNVILQSSLVVTTWEEGVGVRSNIYDFYHPPTCVDGNDSDIPSAFELSQNYPNPFNPKTIVTFAVSRPGNVSIVVFDMLGRQVSVLTAGFRSQGVHSLTFDGSDLASGIYFCVGVYNGMTFSRKMILLK